MNDLSSLKLLWRRYRRHCRGCRILAVEVANERPGDIQSVRCINERYLAAVNDHIDVMRFGINFQRLADVILERSKHFLAPAIIGGLSVFTLALKILLQLIQLILFRL